MTVHTCKLINFPHVFLYCSSQIVSYVADKGGYRPHIQYIGKGAHPPPPPAYANVKIPAQLLEPTGPAYSAGPASHSGYGAGPLVAHAALPTIRQYPVVQAAAPISIPHGPQYGHSYGGDYGYGESNLSPARISKKRALLYDRTLFRRDIPQPATTPRK